MASTEERLNETQVQLARLEQKVDNLNQSVVNLERILRNGLLQKVAVIEDKQKAHIWWVRTITIIGGGQMVALVALAFKLFGGS